MTIFEMLEKLETEIISLRTRCETLAAPLSHPSPNGDSGRPAKKPGARKKKRSKKVAARSGRKAEASSENVSEQLELQVAAEPASTAEQPERVLGKRQALGRSLVQLRKMSAWRTHRSHEE